MEMANAALEEGNTFVVLQHNLTQEAQFLTTGDASLQVPLEAMYKRLRKWKGDMKHARQWATTNIGFPTAQKIVVEDVAEKSHVDYDSPGVAQLEVDIENIKDAKGCSVDDATSFLCDHRRGQTVQVFTLHGLKVMKIIFEDADVHAGGTTPYSTLPCAQHFEKTVDSEMDEKKILKPSLAVVQWIVAEVLLATGGQIRGQSQDFWKRARDLAQQLLYKDDRLAYLTQWNIDHPKVCLAKTFEDMLELVKQGITEEGFNPYYQRQRDECAVASGLLRHVSADIFMAVDGKGEVIVFAMSDCFQRLLSKRAEHNVVTSLDNYSNLQPVPMPDPLRDGLHWLNWLPHRRDLDYRDPTNHPHRAKSGVYDFGTMSAPGDPDNTQTPVGTKDLLALNASGKRSHVYQQSQNLRHSALGSCAQLADFFLHKLDPKLRGEYRDAVHSLEGSPIPHFFSTSHHDPFLARSLRINAAMYEHENQDLADWHHGLAGFVSVGDYEGGDLILRDLALQIECKPGSVVLFRNRELRHSTTRWTGPRRFDVKMTTQEAVRQWITEKNHGIVLARDDGLQSGDQSGAVSDQSDSDTEPDGRAAVSAKPTPKPTPGSPPLD